MPVGQTFVAEHDQIDHIVMKSAEPAERQAW
jgi:hypothetical protein